MKCGVLVNRENVTSSPRSGPKSETIYLTAKNQDKTPLTWHLHFSWAEISEQPLPSAPLGGPLGEVNFYLMIFRAH